MSRDPTTPKQHAASPPSDTPHSSPSPDVSRHLLPPGTPGALSSARPSAPPYIPDHTLLRSLGVDPATVVSAQPMQSGLSGARLIRLTLRHTMPGGAAYYSSRVLKALPPSSGWLGAAAHDTHVREAQL